MARTTWPWAACFPRAPSRAFSSWDPSSFAPCVRRSPCPWSPSAASRWTTRARSYARVRMPWPSSPRCARRPIPQRRRGASSSASRARRRTAHGERETRPAPHRGLGHPHLRRGRAHLLARHLRRLRQLGRSGQRRQQPRRTRARTRPAPLDVDGSRPRPLHPADLDELRTQLHAGRPRSPRLSPAQSRSARRQRPPLLSDRAAAASPRPPRRRGAGAVAARLRRDAGRPPLRRPSAARRVRGVDHRAQGCPVRLLLPERRARLSAGSDRGRTRAFLADRVAGRLRRRAPRQGGGHATARHPAPPRRLSAAAGARGLGVAAADRGEDPLGDSWHRGRAGGPPRGVCGHRRHRLHALRGGGAARHDRLYLRLLSRPLVLAGGAAAPLRAPARGAPYRAALPPSGDRLPGGDGNPRGAAPTLAGGAWDQSKVWRTSETLWNWATSTDPQCAICWNNLGSSLTEQKRHAEAETAYRRALALRPNRATVINNVATALYGQGKYREAEEMLKLALKLDPNLTGALMNMGALKAQEGHYTEALTYFRPAYARDPSFGDLARNLALALVSEGGEQKKAGRRLQAMALYQEALVVKPDDAEARRQLDALRVEAASAESPSKR